MKKLTILLAASAIAAAFTAPASAAIYMKYDGVDGEAKAASFGRGSGAMQSLDLTINEDPVAVGLLLPAVQGAREAASSMRAAPGRPKRFSTFELTDDSAGKTWTLHDAQAIPGGGAHKVKILFRCKDWSSFRTGRTGSDCAAPGRKGNVETEFKVEKGE